MRAVSFFITLVIVFSPSHFMSAEASEHDNPELVRRMLLEGPSHWQAMERELRGTRCEYLMTDTEIVLGQPSEAKLRDVQITYRERFFLIRVAYREAPGRESVYGRNEAYGFFLEGHDCGGTNPLWTVDWIGEEGGDKTSTSVDLAEAELGGMLKLPWSIGNVPLTAIVASPRFVARRSAARAVGGRDCLSMTFGIVPTSDGTDEFGGLSGGEMLLDAERHWAVLAYTADYRDKKMSDMVSLEYEADNASRAPRLMRVKYDVKAPPDRILRVEIEVKSSENAVAEDEFFTLSAFGLNEYRPSRLRGTGIRLGMLLVAAICGICAFVLRRPTRPARTPPESADRSLLK